MLRSKSKIILLLLVTGLSGCDFVKTKEEKQTASSSDKPVARVFSRYLYKNDLREATVSSPPAEKAALEKKFIGEWIEKQLMLVKAETVIDPNSEDIQKKLADYQRDLLIYEYEKEFLREKLDTSVSEKSIQDFYQNNTKLFQLKQNIIKGDYLQFPNNAPELERVKALMFSEKPKEKAELKSYCLRFAVFYSLDETVWLNFDELTKSSPFAGIENKSQFIENTKFAQNNNAAFTYFIKITDFRVNHTAAPLEFVKDEIKSTIINERKLKLLKELRENIYKEAKEKNDFEIYK